MWSMGIPVWEFGVRALAVYLFLLVLLRIGGKRQISQLTPFDFVLMLVLSNAVQNSMNGGDNSLIGGLISAGALVVINLVVGWITRRNHKVEQVLEGHPIVLVHNGKIYQSAMDKCKLTRHELFAALRENGCENADHVHFAIFENNGTISVSPRPNG